MPRRHTVANFTGVRFDSLFTLKQMLNLTQPIGVVIHDKDFDEDRCEPALFLWQGSSWRKAKRCVATVVGAVKLTLHVQADCRLG